MANEDIGATGVNGGSWWDDFSPSKSLSWLEDASSLYFKKENTAIKKDEQANEAKKLQLLADKQAFDRLNAQADKGVNFGGVNLKDNKTLMMIGAGIVGLVLIMK